MFLTHTSLISQVISLIKFEIANDVSVCVCVHALLPRRTRQILDYTLCGTSRRSASRVGPLMVHIFESCKSSAFRSCTRVCANARTHMGKGVWRRRDDDAMGRHKFTRQTCKCDVSARERTRVRVIIRVSHTLFGHLTQRHVVYVVAQPRRRRPSRGCWM